MRQWYSIGGRLLQELRGKTMLARATCCFWSLEDTLDCSGYSHRIISVACLGAIAERNRPSRLDLWGCLGDSSS
jgi:hypothetical protein